MFLKVIPFFSQYDSDNNDEDENAYYYFHRPIRSMLLDSFLVGGIVFVSTLPETHLPGIHSLYVATRGFLYYFLAQLLVDNAMRNVVNSRKKRKSKGRKDKK